MKVKGLDGRTYTLKLYGRVPFEDDTRPRSILHINARKLLRELFPLERVLEEVYLPGSQHLTVDFFIPTRKLMVEVHGEQHYHFVPFFHETILNFIESRKRDIRKIEWANLNNFVMVILPYDEDINGWRKRLCKR